ncbi:MAG: SGNH/GDSL hydrolase family protein [Candidatus Latescibacteria bacterium]|nr:SGNH/GDSL hydrolase family protein [Candidatus Latescibacterota bacterium]
MNTKPKVLLAGDSISMGYGPHVQARLDGVCEVTNLPANSGTSANLLAHADEWLIRPEFDVIHLNCGLHDLGRERDAVGPRVSLEQYEANLREIFCRLKEETGSRLAWATITPVVDERHAARKGFDRFEKDVLAYNAVALRAAQAAGLPVDDLHRVVEAGGREGCVGPDGVHMTDAGNAVLADAVAAFVTDLLKGEKSHG